MSTSPLRFAILGAGEHSALHHGSALKSYCSLHPGEILLAAVCDLDAGKARAYAEQFGFTRSYTDLAAMLAAERLDGLIAVTPLAVTEKIAAELLPRKIPLVIEKPTGDSAAATRRLLSIAQEHSSPHMVSFNRRYIPAVTRVREWLAARSPEQAPKIVVGRMLRVGRREAKFVTGTGIHLIDTVLSIMGAPRKVVSCQAPTDQPGSFFHDALLDFGDGRSAAIVVAPQTGIEEETLEIQGQGYVIYLDTHHCAFRVLEGRKETLSWSAPANAEYAYSCGSLAETEAFVAALRGRAPYWPGLKDSLLTMMTAEAIEAGGEVAIEPPA